MAVTQKDWDGPLMLHLAENWAEASAVLLDVCCMMFAARFTTAEEAQKAGVAFGSLVASGAMALIEAGLPEGIEVKTGFLPKAH